MADDDTPRIHVDSDWKDEAQREKEEADRQAAEEQQEGQIPDASLIELVQMVTMQAAVGLGGMQDPQTGQRIPANLPVAKHYIDLLGLLEEKTRGNLDEDEQKILEGTLQELRMAFVQVAGVGSQPGGDQE